MKKVNIRTVVCALLVLGLINPSYGENWGSQMKDQDNAHSNLGRVQKTERSGSSSAYRGVVLRGQRGPVAKAQNSTNSKTSQKGAPATLRNNQPSILAQVGVGAGGGGNAPQNNTQNLPKQMSDNRGTYLFKEKVKSHSESSFGSGLAATEFEIMEGDNSRNLYVVVSPSPSPARTDWITTHGTDFQFIVSEPGKDPGIVSMFTPGFDSPKPREQRDHFSGTPGTTFMTRETILFNLKQRPQKLGMVKSLTQKNPNLATLVKAIKASPPGTWWKTTASFKRPERGMIDHRGFGPARVHIQGGMGLRDVGLRRVISPKLQGKLASVQAKFVKMQSPNSQWGKKSPQDSSPNRLESLGDAALKVPDGSKKMGVPLQPKKGSPQSILSLLTGNSLFIGSIVPALEQFPSTFSKEILSVAVDDKTQSPPQKTNAIQPDASTQGKAPLNHHDPIESLLR